MRPVEVRRARQLQRGRAFDETPARHIGPALVHDVERPVAAVEIVAPALIAFAAPEIRQHVGVAPPGRAQFRSEEHTSELQSLMRISYAVFCLKKKRQQIHKHEKTYSIQTAK